jgi:outer membrane protein assembly factor BamA
MTQILKRAFVAIAFVNPATAGYLQAQDIGGGPAVIETGVSYSSRRGELAFVGLQMNDIRGSGVDISFGYQVGDDGRAASAFVGKKFALGQTFMGNDSFLRLSVEGRSSDWDSQTYSVEQYKVNLAVGATTAGGLTYSARTFWQTDTLGDFAPNISPLVSELNDSVAAGVGLGLNYSTFDDTGPMATGFAANGAVVIATSLGDREWASAEAGLSYNTALASGQVVALKGEFGTIHGRSGQDVSIIDRGFVGNPMPRGFAFGGIGPRDFVNGSVDTALGGNSYVTSSVELRFNTPSPKVTAGLFVDAGAVWSIDGSRTGAGGGEIDDSYNLRSSVGLSVYWDTQIGVVQVNLANPIQKEALDESEPFSVNLNFQF